MSTLDNNQSTPPSPELEEASPPSLFHKIGARLRQACSTSLSARQGRGILLALFALLCLTYALTLYRTFRSRPTPPSSSMEELDLLKEHLPPFLEKVDSLSSSFPSILLSPTE